MRKLVLLMVSFLILNGCAMGQYKRENKILEKKNQEMEALADEIESENKKLVQKQDELVKKLASRKLTLKELSRNLEGLIKKKRYLLELKKKNYNDVRELGEETKMIKDDIAKLTSKHDEIVRLSKNSSLTLSQMENRKEALIEELQAYLDMGLKMKYRP